METTASHPIRVVASRTGLSANRIRMWEKRYAAVVPHRTATKRRLYTDHDVERLGLLRRATDRDRTIGQVVSLSNEELRSIIAGDRIGSWPSETTTSELEEARAIRTWCTRAIFDLDEERLRQLLARAEVSLTGEVLIEHLVVPLMTEIGERWRDGTLQIMHEHMASALVRSLLSRLTQIHRPIAGAPRLVVATPVEQLHELGALVVSATAASEGWRTLYLGTSVPAREIADAAEQVKANAVALSLSYNASLDGLLHEVRDLRDILPGSVELYVGGGITADVRIALDHANIQILGSLANLRERLRGVRFK